ncbi:hypothetical protein [Kordiimonas aestuarii]|uniref:hypothetical protein n=1 Tax=Kordiimonas aestuarii TaxID=1005925 RepID=UPI0021D3D5A2|nr:hypothetical protein [Kordiimonas aestuarii]
MKTLYLHAGFPKTGSSFLQTVFARNTQFMAETLDIDYQQVDDNATERAKEGRISSGNGNWFVAHLSQGMAVEDALAPYLSGGRTNSLISNENLSHLPERTLEEIRKAAMDYGYKVHAIAFVRDPFELAISAYLQSVKRGTIKLPFEKWSTRFKYKHDKFSALFGSIFETFTVADYGEHKNRLGAAFFDLLGFDGETVPNLPELTVNRSISAEECDFLLKLNAQHDNAAYARRVSDYLVENHAFTGTPVEHTWESFVAVCRAMKLTPKVEAEKRGFKPSGKHRSAEAAMLAARRIQSALCELVMDIDAERKSLRAIIPHDIAEERLGRNDLPQPEQFVPMTKLLSLRSRNRILRAKNFCFEAFSAKSVKRQQALVCEGCDGLETTSEFKAIIKFLVRRRQYHAALWANECATKAGLKNIISQSEQDGLKAEVSSRRVKLPSFKKVKSS